MTECRQCAEPNLKGIHTCDRSKVRVFTSGATRDLDQDKLDYEGFLSPLVLRRFAEYMHKHRQTAAGLRDSDNWQKGIDREAYIKSMWRHYMDVWLHHRGLGEEAEEPLEEALCALMFNVMGFLYETIKPPQVEKAVCPVPESFPSDPAGVVAELARLFPSPAAPAFRALPHYGRPPQPVVWSKTDDPGTWSSS